MRKILEFFKEHKIVTILTTMVLTLSIGVIGNCGGESSARSPTTAHAYTTVGVGSQYFYIDFDGYILLPSGNGYQPTYLKGLWLNKERGSFIFSDSELMFDSISLLEASVNNKTLIYSLNNSTDQYDFIDCEITVTAFTLEQLRDVDYMKFVNYGSYCSLYFLPTISTDITNAYGSISFNFGVDITSISTAFVSLSGVPPTMSYDTGFNDGYNDGVDETWGDISPFQIVTNAIDDFFDTPLFGSTLHIKHILQIGFGCILLGFLIKIFLGG